MCCWIIFSLHNIEARAGLFVFKCFGTESGRYERCNGMQFYFIYLFDFYYFFAAAVQKSQRRKMYVRELDVLISHDVKVPSSCLLP